jgi:hypothetical protein
VIKTDLISYSTPDYTERNLKFDLESLIQTNSTFQTLKKLYLNYKIKSVNFKAIPRVINGTQPQPCYIYLDTQNGYNFDYTALPRLQSSKLLTGKRSQTFKFKPRGRQDDFGYWFSSAFDGPTASIRLRSQAVPDSNIYWQFQITYFITMRGMVQENEQSKKINEGENVIGVNKNQLKGLSEQQIKNMSQDEISSKTESFIKNTFETIEKKEKMNVYYGKTQEQILKNEQLHFRFKIENDIEFLNLF